MGAIAAVFPESSLRDSSGLRRCGDGYHRIMPSPSTTAPSPAPAIRLEQVRFRWRADSPPTLAIDDFRLDAGERVFLHGPSGSGKSTLLSLVGGVLVPEAGEVHVLGTALGPLSAAARDRFRADHVGFVFQMFNLVPYLSLVDNVTLPCLFSQARRARATSAGGCVADEAVRLLDRLGLGLADLHTRRVTDLSVGQQQRVAAARALIGAPEIVVADEPTSALDTDHREAFVRLLFEECARHGTTLLFVSHDASLASGFDRTIRLDEVNRP